MSDLEKNQEKAATVALCLEYVNKVIRKNIEKCGELDGVDFIIDGLILNVLDLAAGFEGMQPSSNPLQPMNI